MNTSNLTIYDSTYQKAVKTIIYVSGIVAIFFYQKSDVNVYHQHFYDLIFTLELLEISFA